MYISIHTRIRIYTYVHTYVYVYIDICKYIYIVCTRVNIYIIYTYSKRTHKEILTRANINIFR